MSAIPVDDVAYSIVDPAPHTLYECGSAADFRARFEAQTGCAVDNVAADVLSPSVPHAIFAVGSLPLGMGSSRSDVDLIVLVDGRNALSDSGSRIVNNEQDMAFFSDSDPLLIGEFLTLRNGIAIDMQIAIAPQIQRVYQRLRRRGPELSETEVRIVGRLNSGWLLWESPGYFGRNAAPPKDPTFAVYCCTKKFVSAVIQQRKARKALGLQDIPLALQHGRTSIEEAYLAYFASEGMAYLGSKWLAQLGHAHGARERLTRHPQLAHGISLLFPAFASTTSQADEYLGAVGNYLGVFRGLIERKMFFKIAFQACPQIVST